MVNTIYSVVEDLTTYYYACCSEKTVLQDFLEITKILKKCFPVSDKRTVWITDGMEFIIKMAYLKG